MRERAIGFGRTLKGLVLMSREVFKIFFVKGWTKA